MSVTKIPVKVQIRLWGKAAGRCQYDGCNKPLWLDSLTKAEFNTAYIAHIVADQPDGPRGHPVLSPKLKNDIENLMLMCDEHHRLIDREDVEGHPVERLLEMKKKHEDRVDIAASISEDKQSHVLLYGANIGEHNVQINWNIAAQAMVPNFLPAERQALEISLKNSSFQDDEKAYWVFERENLRRQFNQVVTPRINSGNIKHLSIFAFAPQPLLIELGRLLSDIPAAEIYQLHREPPNWKWQDSPEGFEYIVKEPSSRLKDVAINLSLSGAIDNSRITSVLGDEVSIWVISSNDPNNDFLKSPSQLAAFRCLFRRLLNRLKLEHGNDARIHIFPSVPVSVAIDVGRVWMPKADLPMMIYDQNTKTKGFSYAFEIKNTKE